MAWFADVPDYATFSVPWCNSSVQDPPRLTDPNAIFRPSPNGLDRFRCAYISAPTSFYSSHLCNSIQYSIRAPPSHLSSQYSPSTIRQPCAPPQSCSPSSSSRLPHSPFQSQHHVSRIFSASLSYATLTIQSQYLQLCRTLAPEDARGRSLASLEAGRRDLLSSILSSMTNRFNAEERLHITRLSLRNHAASNIMFSQRFMDLQNTLLRPLEGSVITNCYAF